MFRVRPGLLRKPGGHNMIHTQLIKGGDQGYRRGYIRFFCVELGASLRARLRLGGHYLGSSPVARVTLYLTDQNTLGARLVCLAQRS